MVDRLKPDLTTKNIRNAGESVRILIRELQGWDTVIWEDDFLTYKTDAELQSRYLDRVTGGDGSIDIVAAGVSGEATIDVGDGGTSGDNEYGGWLLGNLQWKGDLNCFTICRFKISAIGTTKVEFGFTDAVDDAGAVDVLATPSVTATNAAVWVVDTDDTATWQALGVKATVIQKDETVLYADVSGTSTATPIADTYFYMGVFLEGDHAMYSMWDASGNKVGDDLIIDNAIEGGTTVAPWIFVQNRAGSQDRFLTVDYTMTGQRRS